MKKTIKLAVVAALALGTTSAFATNGAELIGTGAKSRGMAGVGIGMALGAESALSNPALITSVKGTEVSFGGTLFMPKVKNDNGGATANSTADKNVIPEVSLASQVNDNFSWGVGMWGTGGMGVDYRTQANQMKMVTNLQIMQFGVPLAYTTNGFSIAVTPIIQYGSLDINYVYGTTTYGAGVAQDLETGYNLGASYTMSGLTVGAVYKSQIDMNYKGVLTNVMTPFMNPGSTWTSDKLSTPAEMGAGVSYVFGENTIAVDYKNIQWSKAKGYKDFEWKDQSVIAIGYQYKTDGWAARIGYNYAKSPIKEQSISYNNSAGLNGDTINMFNLLGFPATPKTHIGVGGTYNFSKTTSLDLAYTYAPEVTETFKVYDAVHSVEYNMSTKHSQSSVSAQLNYNF